MDSNNEIWSASATGLSLFLAYAPTYAVAYGTLAGVIVTLLFFYLTGAAIIFGAEVNAVVNARRTGAATSPNVEPDASG